MKLPTHRHFDIHRKTTWLYFDDEEPRESYMRGGICFPMKYKSPQGIENKGYAVIGGQNVKTGIVHIYEQMSWVTVDDILATDGDPEMPVNAVKYPGFSHWLNKVWNEYFSQTFYFNQSEELSRRFRLQILRSFMINPKPRIVEVPISDKLDFLSSIWLWVKTERIKIGLGTELLKNLDTLQKDDKTMYPSVYALGCCLLGLERFPWRKPYERPIQEVLVA